MKTVIPALLLVVVLAACAPGPVSPTEAALVPTDPAPTNAPAAQPTAPAATEAEAPAAASPPAWYTLPLVNARTGETFTFADFAGRTVFVEPMATWCTNCRQQLGNVASARQQLGDDVVFVAVSVETNLSAETLARYADNNGFDWTFAVLTADMLRELTTAFGFTIANPPSTPHFIIRPDGSTTDLYTGIESPDAIVAQVSEAGGA